MGTKTQKLSNVVDQIVEWQSVVVADGSTNTTAVAGRGYFIDTSAGTHTINLPASPKIGDIVRVSIITAGNTLTIGRNGNNINGSTSDITISGDGDMSELVYVNASEGWKTVGTISAGVFISATGGTVTTSGDYKIHTFTGDGCFVVSSLGTGIPCAQASTVNYIVVAGGGGGGSNGAGGGGAGGFRESYSTCISGPYTASPLATPTGITVTATTYPITVGGGGSAGSPGSPATSGSNSIFSTITSTGGGNSNETPHPCRAGGSGGGGRANNNPPIGTGGTGNTPPTSPPQGNNGGSNVALTQLGAGGGGAGGVGGSVPGAEVGGVGVTTSISGSPTAYAGGAGGGRNNPSGCGSSGSPCGTGGDGGPAGGSATAGSTNTGGGGGGGAGVAPQCGGAGGKGIVIIRYKYQ